MIKKIATMLMLSLLPLIAQEDFLAGVKAEQADRECRNFLE